MTRRTAAVAVDSPVDTTRLYVALGRLTRSLRREAAAPVSHGVLSALVTVVKEGPIRSGELAAREGVAPPSMTKVVTSLEQAGYVERVPDPGDGRAALISATVAGRALVESTLELRLHGLTRRIEALGPDEAAALVAAMPALEALAED
ncbi:MAG: MarR family winged helix-turn-helix transcriptional regulator [Actinomycetales bacterium]